MSIIYLAVPYTNREPSIRNARFDHATKATAKLMADGAIVFCPVVMYHPVDKILAGKDNTCGTEYWLKVTDHFVEKCDELVILTCPGWDKSPGIAHEVERFAERGIEPTYMSP